MARRVVFLDDDDDVRASLCDLMRFLGAGCDAVGSVAELQALVERSPPHDLAILDINLGPGEPSGLDAYRWLRSRNHPGRIAFLTGHARSHPLVAEASRLGDAAVYDKPITVPQLRELLA